MNCVDCFCRQRKARWRRRSEPSAVSKCQNSSLLVNSFARPATLIACAELLRARPEPFSGLFSPEPAGERHVDRIERASMKRNRFANSAAVATMAAVFALASPAAAKTAGECKQAYASAKAKVETAVDEQAYVKACLADESGAWAEGSDGAASDATGESATDLAKKIQNPIGDLYSFPFQSNTNFGYGPEGGTQEVLNIQPVIPIHITPDWNIITRTILPPSGRARPGLVPSMPFGTAPISASAFLSPKNPVDHWLWGVGPVVQVPTISSRDLGSSVWGAGPTAGAVYLNGPIVAGRARQQHLVARRDAWAGRGTATTLSWSSPSSTTISARAGTPELRRSSRPNGR